MLSLHPILALTSFVMAIVFRLYYFPVRKALSPLLWQMPLLLIVTCANPLFSASGSTELFRVGASAIYFESLCFGATSGLILLSSMLWFASAAQFLTSDKLMSLSSKHFPQLSLMLSMVLRLIPKLEHRGRLVLRVAKINEPASQGMRTQYLKACTQLMSWSLEDALETSDALRSKRWSPQIKRSSYRVRCLTFTEKFVLAAGILALCMLLFVLVCTTQAFSFYPQMRGTWGIPCACCIALFTLLPLLYTSYQEKLWHSWK